jgi:hypothetical protein
MIAFTSYSLLSSIKSASFSLASSTGSLVKFFLPFSTYFVGESSTAV